MNLNTSAALFIVSLFLYGCTSTQLSDGYVFKLESVGDSFCYGRFTAEGSTEYMHSDIFRYIDYSKGFARDATAKEIDEADRFGFELTFTPNSAIKSACLELRGTQYVDSGGQLLCEVCVNDSFDEVPTCLLDIPTEVSYCKEFCNEKYAKGGGSLDSCLSICNEQFMKGIYQSALKKGKFEIEPTCTEFNISLVATGDSSLKLQYGEPVFVTDSGIRYDALDVCSRVSNVEIYPNTKRVDRYCFSQIKESGILYLKVSKNNEVKQIKIPYTLQTTSTN